MAGREEVLIDSPPGGAIHREKGIIMVKLIIEANREGYATDQIRKTMTVGDLISMLEQYDEDTPVYLGHDPQSYGWYTYSGITEGCFNEVEDEEEEKDEYDE